MPKRRLVIPTLLAVAMPGCGFGRMRMNLATGAVVGTAVAGFGYALTGRGRGDC